MRVLLCTCPPAAAGDLAEQLLARRLVACVNIVSGVESRYRWKGRIERETEALLILKTTPEQVEGVIAALDELHPYDVPELIALPVVEGAAPYLRWVSEQTGPDAP